jgi:hypothetical protein
LNFRELEEANFLQPDDGFYVYTNERRLDKTNQKQRVVELNHVSNSERPFARENHLCIQQNWIG